MTSLPGTATPAPTPRTATVPTPIGPFTVITADIDGAATVLASGWTDDVDDLLPLIAAELRPDSLVTVGAIGGVTDAVTAYHSGDLAAIDRVPVAQRSGPFLMRAWDVLRTVQPGHPVTYTDYAALAGSPRAVRAAGAACARNAAALFVPCHRVLPRGGDTTRVGGFRWGASVKSWLLAHEGAEAAAP